MNKTLKLLWIFLLVCSLRAQTTAYGDPTAPVGDNSRCRYRCAQCNYNPSGNYCSVCSSSKIWGTSRLTASCSGSTLPNCIYDSYASGFNRCSFCERGYALTQQGTCTRFTNTEVGLQGCDIAWISTNGRRHCSGCRMGYYMDSTLTCKMGTVVQNCEVHGYDLSSTNRYPRCIQCRVDYYLTSSGLCQKLPGSYKGCFTPDLAGGRGECYFCDGYHGYLEAGIARVSGSFAYKLCDKRGKNWGRTGSAIGVTGWFSSEIIRASLMSISLLAVLCMSE